MYENYFGFSDLPFRVTPEPGFFYSNAVYQEALATLRYGIEARKGFIVISGEVGTGKTTLLKILMQRAQPIIHTAFVFHPRQAFVELLRFILKDLGIPASTNEKSILLEQLNQYLIDQLKRGHVVALLLDEAQQLSDDSLEELRLLSNFETDREKLIQIVLMGQPELEQRLDRPELRQLKQRVALRCRLAPLRGYEISEYIDFRLKTVGYEGKELFDRNTVERITHHSRGIPRLINVICDNALLNAYATGKRTISPEIIEEVAADLQLNAPPPVEQRPTSSVRPKSRDAIPHPENQPLQYAKTESAAALYRTRILSAAAIGVLLLVVAVAAGSVALYSQSNKRYFPHALVTAQGDYEPSKSYLSHVTAGVKNNYQQSREYLSHVAAEAREFVDTHLDNIKRTNRTPKIATQSTIKETGAAEGEATGKEPHSALRKAPELAAKSHYSTDAQPSSGTQGEQPGATEALIHKPDRSKPQRSESQRYSLKENTVEGGSLKGPKKDARLFRGHFEVIRDSVVFEKPTMEAAIIATLSPRTWVRVEERVGNYLRVLSLNDPWVRGYVHMEDAAFEYIGFAHWQE